MRRARTGVAGAIGLFLAALCPLFAQTIATADLQISGIGLRVIDTSVSTALDIPVTIQTEFGGKRNDDAPAIPGLLAVAELTGPGVETPLRLETTPGHPFRVPGLTREGTWLLQNIRLVNAAGELLQPATPSLAVINVANVVNTQVRVRQLSPEELRARGISIDARNQTVYEYTFTFLINGQPVQIPFPVVIDDTTRQVTPIQQENPYNLPSSALPALPRWSPPQTIPVDLGEEFPSPQAPEELEGPSRPVRRSIPAAIVIPNDIAILHQFFAVALIVTNNSEGEVKLDSIHALMKPPAALRSVRSDPAVAFGQPVPVVDAVTGVTFLVAQAQGEAEWTMEGLKPGTHRFDIDIRATLQSPGQQDVPLRGTASAAILVHDPRFNITFSHPETVRKDLEYSTFTFITNLSGVAQTISVASDVPACAASPGANVCRVDPTERHDLTIPSGAMRMIEYRLRAGTTGQVFATAGDVQGQGLDAAVQLHLGVSESGIPLSPATLVMPHYARYLDQELVSSYLSLLGLGYSVATSPMNQATASLPRVIKTDVFQRALDLARAGQRVFLGEPMFDSLANLSLDLLGNTTELREWDELRRRESAGRTAGAAVLRQLETHGLGGGVPTFVERFGRAASWREPFLLAAAHGAGQPALSLRGSTSGRRAAGTNESSVAVIREIPFADLSTLGTVGEIALAGRWIEDLEILVTPRADGAVTVDALYPGPAAGTLLRVTVDLAGKKDEVIRIPLSKGNTTVQVINGPLVNATALTVEPMRILAARQDLFLDQEGHRVSILLNRPTRPGLALGPQFSAEVSIATDGLNYHGNRPIAGAALQEERRIINLSFDHALHRNAAYVISLISLLDGITSAEVALDQQIAPVIDNDSPAGILHGRVLQPGGAAIPNAEVRLTNGTDQFDKSRDPDGTFLFEAVPRDPANGVSGAYRLQAVTTDGKHTSISGAVRLPGRVQFVDLVFLGRGRAEGVVRYEDGQRVANAAVTIGSTLFQQARRATANSSGFYRIEDLPVGPLTFSATDESGNIGFASEEIKTAGQLVVQDISIARRPFPGVATVRGRVLRSDDGEPVVAARVGVFARGFAVAETSSDSEGGFEFRGIPSGLVSVLAAEWSVSRESTAVDFDLAADEVRDVTLTLRVLPAEPLVSIEGEVKREDPLFPGDASRYQRVAGALVRIDGGQVVTADADGRYLFESVPASFAARWLRAYDPATRRTGAVQLPALNPTNTIPVLIRAQDGFGTGSVRVRLLNAGGFPVSGYRVIDAGIPPVPFNEIGNGVYELTNVRVGRQLDVWAVPRDQSSPHGDQTANGSVRVEFNGHVASLALRLPGQGRVRVKLRTDVDILGDVELSFLAWDEGEQALSRRSRFASTGVSGQDGFAVFENVPATAFTASSAHPTLGHATQDGRLGFDGDVATITLQLNRLASVGGRVYAIDGVTPIAGATVRISDGAQILGSAISGSDGSFQFHGVTADAAFRVAAEKIENGVFRTGVAGGRTPEAGGPVDNVAVMMRRQGSVDGRIVYAAYKVFDPLNPANNVIDDTPGTLADNAPVPLALFDLRELDFPSRAFGTASDPLSADAAGRFTLNNIFQGPFRISAADPGNPELRGSLTGTMTFEGERLTPILGIGEGGVGSATILVIDPNNGGAPVPNVDVTLLRAAAPYDIGSTTSTGAIRFDGLPVGPYSATAYSKALGRSGSTSSFAVQVNGNTDALIVLQFSGVVEGRVIDPEGGNAAVPGALVSLSAFGVQARTTTDPQGNFTIDGVRDGPFEIEAREAAGPRRAVNAGVLSLANPRPFVSLALEPTATLHLGVYLPNDSGGDSNIPAPLVSLEVRQGCRFFDGLKFCEITRRLQGNPFQLAGLLERGALEIDLVEVGGDERRVSLTSTFPQGSAASPLRVILPAFGSVEVRVSQGSGPAANATVRVSGGGRDVRGFTDPAGVAILRGVPLGSLTVQAESFDARFTAATNAQLSTQSNTLVIPLSLGTFATVFGFVDAELSGPSAGTRVVAQSGSALETMTDADGRYQFTGIATGSMLHLTYIGPDDVTVGARQSVQVAADLQLPRVRLDATPPQLLGTIPADGAQSVSPDMSLRFTFSETIAPQFLNHSYFQLIPADSSTAVAAGFSSSTAANGEFIVTLIPPPAPPGQTFPLLSNTLYRIVVSDQITDLTGHRLPGTRGASFITADYSEPRVIRVLPPPALPIPAATTFEFRFNEPVDPSPWLPGGNASARLFRLNSFGSSGVIIAEKSGRTFLDANNLSLFFAPNDPIEEQSFFRLVFSGVRDLQGNVLGEQIYHFFSFDRVKPVVSLVSPVPGGFPLVSGVEYTLNVELRNPDGSNAVDIERVDYVRVEGATEQFLFTTSKTPFAYKFVAPENVTSLSIRTRARDLSANESDPATMQWNVVPNLPPQNVAVALTPATPVYPGRRVSAAVSFQDEGVLVTVQVAVSATQQDGSPYTTSQTRSLSRATVADPWPAALFDVDLPPTLRSETRATFSATATDSRGQQGLGSAGVDLLKDTVEPEVTITLPVADTLFQEGTGNRITLRATILDSEVAVREARASIEGGGQIILTRGANNEFSGELAVPSVEDLDIVTRVVTFTATDYESNTATETVPVRIEPLYDPNAPVGQWTCTTRGAMAPAGATLRLRVFALGNDNHNPANGVQRVELLAGVSSPPIPGTAVAGMPDHYEASYTIPADAVAESTIQLRAVITNVAGSSSEITSSILVVTGESITFDTTIQPSDTSLENKTVIVRSGTLQLVGPHRLERLVVLDGARVSQVLTTPSIIQKLELTASATYVSCAGAIDVSERGFSGATGDRGQTWPNAAAGGSRDGSGGSHGGRGGQHTLTSESAPPYGSVFDPSTPGGQGGPSRTVCSTTNCSSGGGVIRLNTDSLVLDGQIRANGGPASHHSVFGGWGGSAGGSIRIDATTISGGGGIHADGGNGAEPMGTGGGGRIAIYYDTLALDRKQISAAGGEPAWLELYRRGSPGTMFLKSSSDPNGELLVDNTGRESTQWTTLNSIGMRTASETGIDFVRAAGAQFPSPDLLRGIRLIVNGDRIVTWPVVSNTADQIRVDVSGAPLSAQTGQSFRGLYRFDRVILRFARVETEDLVEIGSPLEKDPASILISGNAAAPVLDGSRIALASSAFGPAVSGAPLAVQDSDLPITVIATNTRTGVATAAAARPDGSFVIGVTGLANDLIAVRARDGHRFPLESPTLEAGRLPADVPAPLVVPIPASVSQDANFLSRGLAVEGRHLGVYSRREGNTGNSRNLVLYDVTNPAVPQHRQTVALDLGDGMKDVVIHNGWAYVVGSFFKTINLGVSPVTVHNPDVQSGYEAVALDGTYAFLSDSNANGTMSVFDVTNPALPRRAVEASGITPRTQFTTLHILGADYLVATTPRKTTDGIGHDVVVIDRRDIRAMRTVADLDIPGFDAYRSRLEGSLLHLAGQGGAFTTVDLSNPVQPVVRTPIALLSGSRGLVSAGNDVLVAATSAGVVHIHVTNPSAATVVGSLPVAPAWDTTLHGLYAYIAHENGITVARADVGPRISKALLSGVKEDTLFRVLGALGAISGKPPLTAELRNDTTGTAISGLAVAGEGSFSHAIPASAGDRISVTATDGSNRSAGPVFIGAVPFGSATTFLPISATLSQDANFLSRGLALEGRHLGVYSRREGNTGNSRNLVLYDVTNPAVPQHRQTVALDLGDGMKDVVIHNGWAYVVGFFLKTINLGVSPVTVHNPDVQSGYEAVAVDGTYAFLSDTNANGTMSVFDVTNPALPRRAVEASGITPRTQFTTLHVLGADYLVATTPRKTTDGIGHDVVVIDRRDIRAMRTVADLDIPGFDAYRSRLEGNLLYLAGQDVGVAVVDLSNPLQPALRSVTNTPGITRGLDVTGASVAAADGNLAVTFLDATNPASVLIRGVQAVAGNNWDARYGSSVLYVATEQGLAVIDGIDVAPKIDPRLITVRFDGSSNALVSGAPASLSGKAPLTIELRNEATAGAAPGLAVEANGSFLHSVAALPGHRISIKVTDGAGRTAGPVIVGMVPFGTATTLVPIPSSLSQDQNFLARGLAVEGRHLGVYSRRDGNTGNSRNLVLFDVTNPASPVHRQSLNLDLGDTVKDVAIHNGWAYVVGYFLRTVNLNVSPVTVHAPNSQPGGEAVAVDGTYAFVTDAEATRAIFVYDVTNPAQPRLMGNQSLVTPAGVVMTSLHLLGSDYLVATTSRKSPNGAGHDVVVIDRRDVNQLRMVTDLDIPAFDAHRSRIEGNLLYLAGLDGGVAEVDLSNPLQPTVSRVDTPGLTRGLDVTGGMVAAADGFQGFSMIQAGALLGTQSIAGSVWDARYGNNVLYLATEQGLGIIHNVEAPPVIHASLITATTDGAALASVSGALNSVTGAGPLTADLHNVTTGASTSGLAVINGGFAGIVAARSGERLRVTATDGKARSTSREIGSVPFANTTSSHAAGAVQANDANFRARRLSLDGNRIGLTTGSTFGTNTTRSNVQLLFTQPAMTLRTLAAAGTSPGIQDHHLANGFAFVASGNFSLIDWTVDPALVRTPADRTGSETAVTVVGNFAYVASDSNGMIRTYDVTDPTLPQFLGEQSVQPGAVFRKLIPFGSNYLLGVAPEKDLTVVDRATMLKVGDLDVPSFQAIDGVVEGSIVYLTGGDAGIAIVDLTAPAAPQTLSILDTPGIARGVAVSGANEIVVADSSGPGVTFINAADRSAPILLGSQRVSGNAVDVKTAGRTVYVATEQHLFIMIRP